MGNMELNNADAIATSDLEVYCQKKVHGKIS